MGGQERAGIFVPERFIPTPSSVGPPARALLSKPPPFGRASTSTVMLHRALGRAGIEARLHIRKAVAHGVVSGAPETKELMDEHVQFLLARTGTD